MCQASSKLEQAQQKLVLKQLKGRIASVQLELKEWSHLFGHLTSPLTLPLQNAAEPLVAVLSQLNKAEEIFANPPIEQPSNVTFVSK